MGLGWEVSNSRGVTLLFKTGYVASIGFQISGFRAAIALLPELNIGITTLWNSGGDGSSFLANILEHLIPILSEAINHGKNEIKYTLNEGIKRQIVGHYINSGRFGNSSVIILESKDSGILVDFETGSIRGKYQLELLKTNLFKMHPLSESGSCLSNEVLAYYGYYMKLHGVGVIEFPSVAPGVLYNKV
jgi:hypothetical protein